MEVGAVSHSGNAFNATLSLGLEIIFKVLGTINQSSTTMLPTPAPHMFSLLKSEVDELEKDGRYFSTAETHSEKCTDS